MLTTFIIVESLFILYLLLGVFVFGFVSPDDEFDENMTNKLRDIFKRYNLLEFYTPSINDLIQKSSQSTVNRPY